MKELMPEQYELHDTAGGPRGTAAIGDWRRRDFFKALGCGVLAVLVEPVAGQAIYQRGQPRSGTPTDVSAWLHIDEQGIVTIYCGKTEVGQNIRTSLAQAVAEELRVPMESVKMLLADTKLVPYDAGTFGSQSTPQMGSRLHFVAAAAREAMFELAEVHFKTERANLTVADGRVLKIGGDSVTFGQLTKGQKIAKEVTTSAPVTPIRDWKICGASAPKVNGRDFVTGKHKFTSDMNLPGMVFGKILRPPSFDAALVSFDAKPAEAYPGVLVFREGDFIGLTAPDILTAARAIKAIKAEWKEKAQPSSSELFDVLRQNAAPSNGQGKSIEEALAKADHKLKQTYDVAYIAHVPLEPRAAVARWDGDEVTVWTGTQRPFGVRNDVARELKLENEKVRVIVPDTGSGFGGKHTVATAVEAARLARGAGRAVKVVWTREEEFTWAYFRPAGVIDVSAGVSNEGTLTAWAFTNINSGASSIRTPYEAPNPITEFRASKSPLKQGSYRALAATANHFARESAMDELAAMVEMDPLQFRLKNLKEPRLRAVLEAAAGKFGWGKQKSSANRGFGLAVGTEKGSFVATCAEVSISRETGAVRVVRAVTAFECGAVVNPEHLKNQVEGCVVMGIGGALFEEIRFTSGKIDNPHLADYRVPRFEDTPKMETVLLDRRDLPSAGGSETPIITIAPAIGNAIFAATKIRLRSLPMVPKGLKA